MSGQKLFRQIAFHFVMGAVLGAFFMTALFTVNANILSDAVLRSTSPFAAFVVLMAGGSLYFAFGAAITGFHFMIMDENRSRGDGA